MQLPFFEEPSGQLIPLQDGELLYYPHFYKPQVADAYFCSLMSGIVETGRDGDVISHMHMI